MDNSIINTKGLLTIAIGKKYVKQAKYLAYSCMLNSPHTLRAAVTNFPDKLSPYYDFTIPWTDSCDPFSIKTRIYELSPFNKTLYIDADSLVFHPLDDYWNYLKNNSYVYEGKKLTGGEWYFDIKKICTIIQTGRIPIFNSGMLLFSKSETAKQIFDTAHYYFSNHKKEGIEIPYFRGNHYPDEPAFAIALAKHNIEPVNDYGRFSRTLINATDIKIDVTKRIARFIKNDKFVYPLVVHFCGRIGNIFYRIQKRKLFFLFANPLSKLFFNTIQRLRKYFNTSPNPPSFPS